MSVGKGECNMFMDYKPHPSNHIPIVLTANLVDNIGPIVDPQVLSFLTTTS